MSASEDMSHPGYWGGVILVGRDTYVDIQTVRRKALENAIDSSTSLVRSSACIGDGKIDIDGNTIDLYSTTISSTDAGEI